MRELALQSTCTVQVTYKKTCFGGGGKSRIFVTNKFTEEAWSEDRDMGRSGELAVLGQATTVRKRGGAFFPQAPSSDSQTERGPCAVALVYGCRASLKGERRGLQPKSKRGMDLG